MGNRGMTEEQEVQRINDVQERFWEAELLGAPLWGHPVAMGKGVCYLCNLERLVIPIPELDEGQWEVCVVCLQRLISDQVNPSEGNMSKVFSKEMRDDIEKVKAQEVEGWWTDEEGLTCLKMIHQLMVEPSREPRQAPIIVEIGSFMGKSSRWFALAAKHWGCRVYCIDHFQGNVEHQEEMKAQEIDDLYPLWAENMERVGLREHVTLNTHSSQVAWQKWQDRFQDRGQIDFLLIDGSHEEEDVRFDISHWGGLIREGGFLAMHDPWFPGVQAARAAEIEMGGRWVDWKNLPNLWFYR